MKKRKKGSFYETPCIFLHSGSHFPLFSEHLHAFYYKLELLN